MCTFLKLREAMRRIETVFLKWISIDSSSLTPQLNPALVGLPNTLELDVQVDQEKASSIFDPVMWKTVPRQRRSRERRMERRFGKHIMERFMTVKTNLVPCLECGHMKESNCLCENCYKRIKGETEEMMAKMGEDLKYNVPRQEVAFKYEGEEDDLDSAENKGKYIVEMEKPRPQWFSDILMTKVKGRKS